MSNVSSTSHSKMTGFRRSSFNIRLIMTVGAFSCASMNFLHLPRSIAQSHPGSAVLSLRIAIDTPSYIVNHSWSNKSRHVAFLFWNPPIYILDLATHALVPTTIADIPAADVALNDDANLLIVTAGAEARAYSTASQNLVSRASVPLSDCRFAHKHGVAFVPGTDHVLIACTGTQPASKSVVLRYALPGLKLSDSLQLPRSPETTWQSRSSIDLIGHSVVMTSFTGRLFTNPDIEVRVAEYAFRCLHLPDQTPCFKPIPLGEGSPNANAHGALSADLHTAAISTNAEKIDIYDTASTAMIRSIGLTTRYLRTIFFAYNAEMLIAGFDKSTSSEGGIVVWNRNGETLESIPGVAVEQMSISPDGHQLLVISRRELLLYEISNPKQ